jgi:hypothetical protein
MFDRRFADMDAMRTFLKTLVVATFLVLLAGCATSRGEVVTLTPDEPALSHLAWMTGSWANDSGGVQSEEHWTQPRAGTMFGVNRSMRAGATMFFEYLRIEARPDGVYYIAAPLGRHPPTEFRMTSHADNKVTFENPQHDFPKRITYWRDGDTLHATADGESRGTLRSEVFQWQRARLQP